MKKGKKIAAYALAALLAMELFSAASFASAAEPTGAAVPKADPAAIENLLSSDTSYIDFYSEHKDSKRHYGFL